MKTRIAKVCSFEGEASGTSCGQNSFLAVFSKLSRKWIGKAGATRYPYSHMFIVLMFGSHGSISHMTNLRCRPLIIKVALIIVCVCDSCQICLSGNCTGDGNSPSPASQFFMYGIFADLICSKEARPAPPFITVKWL